MPCAVKHELYCRDTAPRGGSRGRVQGVRIPPPPEMTCGFLIQLVFCKKKTMRFIGVEVEQETRAPPPKKILDPPLAPLLWTGDYNTRATTLKDLKIVTRN